MQSKCIFFNTGTRTTGARATLLRQCETLWSAREIVSAALSAGRERHTENVFTMRVEARSALSVKRFYLIKYCSNQNHFFPKTFSNDPHQLLRWKFFLASIGKNFLACRKKIDSFPTAADKVINNNNNIIFFENSMISVPSIASWEFTNQISTKSFEY